MQRDGGRDTVEEKGQMSDGKKRNDGRKQNSAGDKKGDANGMKSWYLKGKMLVLVREISEKFERRVVLVRRRAVQKD